MPNPAGSPLRFAISRKNRALLAAALFALSPTSGLLRGQTQPDLETIRTRAEKGDAEALNILGNAYASGQGVRQSFAEALRLYQRAAERGHAAAQFNLGMMHELGRGVAQDPAAAFKHYIKAAEQGFAPAQFNVGNMYANGLGVKQDYFDAALWFRQAADQGVPEAQYNLALAYELGRGVGKQEATAQRWYRAAAGSGYARAQYNLALMLEEGRGSDPDPAAAIQFYRAAAAQNFAPAQNNLGILLAEGRGVPANLIEAYTWLAIAVENGAKPIGRDIVAQQLSAEQLQQANAAVTTLRGQLGLREPDRAATPASVVAGPGNTKSAEPAPAPAAVTPPGSPPAEIVALNTRVVVAESEVEKLRAENRRLADSAQTLKKENATLQQRIDAAAIAVNTARTEQVKTERSPELEKLRTENGRLNEDVKRATIELARLNRELRQAQEKLAAPSAPGSTPPAAEAGRVAELTRQVEELRAANEKFAGMRAELARLEAENAQLKAASVASAELPPLQQRAARAEQALAEATKQLDAMSAEKRVLEKRLAEVAAKPSLNPEVMQQVRNQLGDALDELTAAQKASDGLRAELAAAKKALDEKTGQLAAELEQTKQALAQAEAEKARIAGDAGARESAEISNLRQALADAQQALNARGSERGAAAQLTAQLDEATRSLDELKAKNESLVQDLEVAKQSAAAALAAQAAAVKAAPTDALRLEMQTLQNHVRTLETQLEDDRRGAAREVATLAAQLQNSRETNRALMEANRALLQAKSSDDSNVKAELEQVSGQLQSLQAELEKARGEQARLKQLADTAKAEAGKARADYVALQAKHADTAKAADMHGSSVAELTELNERLSAEKAALEKQLAQAQQAAGQELTELRSRVAANDKAAQDSMWTIAELRTANEKLQAELRELGAQMASIRAENTQLPGIRSLLADAKKVADQHSQTVAELTGVNDALTRDVKDLQAQITTLKAENARLAQSDSARQEAEKRVAALNTAAAQLTTAQRDLASARDEIARLNEAVQNLERDRAEKVAAAGETASVRTELADVKSQLADAKKAAEQYGATVAELTGLNEKLTSDLRALQSQLTALRGDHARLAQSDAARREAEERAAALTSAAAQLNVAQRELSGARAEIARLNETVQALDRDRNLRISQLQQENAAIAARLRQAQGTLDQIASAARVVNSGVAAPAAPVSMPAAGRPSSVPGNGSPITPAPRTHVVAEGDSLTRISVRYYGTGNRWQEIYDANREMLKGETALRPGQRLRIP